MISVCIATHNGEKYILPQLQSILLQLGELDEVIISDDGSTDSTLTIIRELEDPRIKIVQMKHKLIGKRPHYYVTKNFENALSFAKGDYIFLSDQDDVWCVNKVSLCLEKLKTADLVVTNMECVDNHLRSLGMYIYNDQFRFNNWLMLKGKYFGCSIAFNRNVLDYVLPFPKKLLLHDFWIGFLAEQIGKVIYINIPLVKYRIHSNNTSSDLLNNNCLYFKLSYRVRMIFSMIIRILQYKIRR